RSEDPFAPVTDVAASLTSFPHPWFISGGWAIDLFLNRVTLRHFRSSLPRSRSYGLRPFDGRGPHDPDVPPPSGVDPERLDGLPAGAAGEGPRDVRPRDLEGAAACLRGELLRAHGPDNPRV